MDTNQPIHIFKKWKTFTDDHDNNYRTKRTQLMMMIKRGYDVPNDEIKFISYGPAAEKYITARQSYFDNFGAANAMEYRDSFEEAQNELIEEGSNNTYEEFNRGVDEFVPYTWEKAGGGTFRDGMGADYRSVFYGKPPVRVIFLNYLLDEKKSKKEVDTTIASLITYNLSTREQIEHLIIIVPRMFIAAVSSDLPTETLITVEFLVEENMKFDPTEHKLQPWFKIMSKEEEEFFIKNNGFNRRQLPKINKKDPVLNFLGVTSEQGVVEFHRHNKIDQIGEVSFYARVF